MAFSSGLEGPLLTICSPEKKLLDAERRQTEFTLTLSPPALKPGTLTLFSTAISPVNEIHDGPSPCED